ALLGMKRARRGDHDAGRLARQELIERADDLRIGRKLLRAGSHLWIGVADRHGLHLAGGEHRFHAIAADPAGAEKTDRDHQAGTTTALTNFPGRSRVALSASSRRSSG